MKQALTGGEKARVEALQWWHRIKLDETGYRTPGICDHGTGLDVSIRFGLPYDLTGKIVLDIGAFDGLFSFEAERRGASQVVALDYYQRCQGQKEVSFEEANAPFLLAKEILGSKVQFSKGTLEDNSLYGFADVVLYYGVLYHVTDPLGALKILANITREQCLIETTYAKDYTTAVLEYRPGFENDPTNTFYPSLSWLTLACKEAGFKSAEVVWKDAYRCTVRALK